MERYIAFLKVLETGSFTKAAALLGYTQPALSQMIASLEKELQVKLLRRSRTGVSLTPEGSQLLAPIQSSVEQYLAMRRAADEVRGLVRIGCISSVSCHWLPQVIRLFWQDHPGVQVVLHQGDYTSIPEWVREGRVNFGFVNPAAVRSMPTLPVKSGEFRAVVPKDSPWPSRTTSPWSNWPRRTSCCSKRATTRSSRWSRAPVATFFAKDGRTLQAQWVDPGFDIAPTGVLLLARPGLADKSLYSARLS